MALQADPVMGVPSFAVLAYTSKKRANSWETSLVARRYVPKVHDHCPGGPHGPEVARKTREDLLTMYSSTTAYPSALNGSSCEGGDVLIMDLIRFPNRARCGCSYGEFELGKKERGCVTYSTLGSSVVYLVCCASSFFFGLFFL